MQTKMLIIAINYYNDADTIAFTKGFFALKLSKGAHLLIVDNSKTLIKQPIMQELEVCNSNLSIMYPKTNLGYLGAACWGLEQYLETNVLPEWVILSNTDIEFVDNLFIEKLLSLYPLGYNGIIAPAIISTLSGRNQNPYMIRRPSRLKMYLLEIATKSFYISTFIQLISIIKQRLMALKKNNINKFTVNGSISKIYAPHGSFIIINRSYFAKGGSLAYGTFLFGEEIFFAESIINMEYAVIYDQRIIILHNEHSTTGIFKSKIVAAYWHEALCYLNKRYFVGKAKR